MRKSKTKAEQLTFWPSLGLPDKERRKTPENPDLSSSNPLYKSQEPLMSQTRKAPAQ